MTNFDWTSFTRKIPVRAPLSALYDAWTKAPAIEKWFLRTADYLDADNKPLDKSSSIQKGHTYSWTWFGYDVTETGKINEANGKDYLQFSFAGDCVVEVKLTEQDDTVVVALTQRNIPIDDESKVNYRLGCDAGWSFFLVNLKSVYEGGLDLRNKDERFKGVVNS